MLCICIGTKIYIYEYNSMEGGAVSQQCAFIPVGGAAVSFSYATASLATVCCVWVGLANGCTDFFNVVNKRYQFSEPARTPKTC